MSVCICKQSTCIRSDYEKEVLTSQYLVRLYVFVSPALSLLLLWLYGGKKVYIIVIIIIITTTSEQKDCLNQTQERLSKLSSAVLCVQP